MKDAFLPTLGGHLSIEVRDPRGSLISQHSQPMRSYVANFNRLVRVVLTPAGQAAINATQMTGAVIGLTGAQVNQWLRSIGAPGSFEGFLIGTSPRAVQGTDFKLGTPYRPGGTTANRFTHNAGTWLGETKAAGTITERYQRTFTNNTASALTVNEVGFAPLSQAVAILVIRDVILPTSVPAAATITVTYDLFTAK